MKAERKVWRSCWGLRIDFSGYLLVLTPLFAFEIADEQPCRLTLGTWSGVQAFFWPRTWGTVRHGDKTYRFQKRWEMKFVPEFYQYR